jgi:hypothetical protein
MKSPALGLGSALCCAALLGTLGRAPAQAVPVTVFDSIGSNPASLVGNPGSFAFVHDFFGVAITTAVGVTFSGPTSVTGISLVVATDGGSTGDWKLNLGVFSTLTGFEGSLTGDIANQANVGFSASLLGSDAGQNFYLVSLTGLTSFDVQSGTHYISVFNDVTTAPSFNSFYSVLGNLNAGVNGFQSFNDGSPAFPTELYGAGDPAYRIQGQINSVAAFDTGSTLAMLFTVVVLLLAIPRLSGRPVSQGN